MFQFYIKYMLYTLGYMVYMVILHNDHMDVPPKIMSVLGINFISIFSRNLAFWKYPFLPY